MSQEPCEPTGPGRSLVDRDTLRRWIESCHPYTPIDPDDERYFDFGNGAQGEDLRGEDHIRGLHETVTLSEKQSCQLFSGFSGTGKSTELRRLKSLLENDGYTVLLVDARDYHDLNHALIIEDLLVVLAGAFGEATAELLGEDLLRDSYWERLRRFLGSEVGIDEVKLKVGITDLKVNVKQATAFWLDIRKALAVAPGQLCENCHQFVGACVTRIQRKRRTSRGVVFIVDNMEQLGYSIFEFHEMMESVIQVLSKWPKFLHLPDCHVIYSIPPYVQLIRPQLRGLYSQVSKVLPAIKVLERGAEVNPYRPGVDALCALVGQRIPLDRIFGERRDLLEKLVIYSGGHVRTLLTFVQDMLYKSLSRGFPPEEEDIEEAVQTFREQARMTIWRGSIPLLDEILRTGAVEELTREEFAFLAEYMDAYIVLCYRNGDGWYEVHPLARDYVKRRARKLAESPPRKDVAEGS